jgi:bifunctional enzyme CysN/CysC
MLFEDQLAALERLEEIGTQGGDIDFALLVDGLAAEREQGITIDVAYRFFATDKRKFIVADTPGHEQYTRNMVTGASTADLAVILIDARKGVLTQTRRHSYLVSLLGIRRTSCWRSTRWTWSDYSQQVFDRIIERSYREFAARIGLTDITAIPMSALRGDNITNQRQHALVSRADAAAASGDGAELDEDACSASRFACRCNGSTGPNLDFRGFAGLIAAARSARATACGCCPRAGEPRRAHRHRGRRPAAGRGRPVGHADLADEIDISRGDVCCRRRRCAGRGRRPVRGHDGVDER